MTSRRFRLLSATTVTGWMMVCASTVCAQAVEITPFGGYRFGGDFFELLALRPVDEDGAPAVGVVVDIPMSEGLQFEASFTHQNALVSVPTTPLGPPARWRISVDHWQGGGLQEFGAARIRPFLTGAVGLTRYATEGDGELRFVVSAGGGVKLLLTPSLGVRLNGQVFTTFVDADARVLACTTGVCFVSVNAAVVWQAEFSAGLIVRFR